MNHLVLTGKMLPPFPGDDSSEVGTESTVPVSEAPSRAPSQSFASSIAEGAAVLEEADRYSTCTKRVHLSSATCMTDY